MREEPGVLQTSRGVVTPGTCTGTRETATGGGGVVAGRVWKGKLTQPCPPPFRIKGLASLSLSHCHLQPAAPAHAGPQADSTVPTLRVTPPRSAGGPGNSPRHWLLLTGPWSLPSKGHRA
jgi:hypothetical protein